MATQVNIYDAKAQLSKLIDRALDGEQVTIARAGRPLVDLVPHVGTPIVFGGLRHGIRYDEAEFDAADQDIAAMFELDEPVGP